MPLKGNSDHEHKTNSMIPAIIPDTNFLLEYPSLLEQKWQTRPIEILISETVESEVYGLTFNSDRNLAQKAKRAHAEIQILKRRSDIIKQTSADIKIRFIPRIIDAKPPLDPAKPDHQLIAYARRELADTPPHFCAILTADRELCDIAEALSVIAIIPDYDGKFFLEIKRKHEWWQKAREAEANQLARKDHKKQTIPPIATTEEQSVYLQLLVNQINEWIRAEKYRAILHLIPLKARIALTTKIIKDIPDPENRVVFVIVESLEEAQYWAGEIRQNFEISPTDIHLFGRDNVDRIDRARAIIYHHEQAVRRLTQHISRLGYAEKKITSIVDSCDLLDPFVLAMLFYESDQFIGYHHNLMGGKQPPGGKTLSPFLRNKTLLSYTFADAECDGWGHPYDLYLRPVNLTPDEKTYWDETNHTYLSTREQALEKYPELRNSVNFWESLYNLLHKTVAPKEAKLIFLREELEGIVQLASQKLDFVEKLHEYNPGSHYRRLIFDYEKQWTPLVLNRLSQKNISVSELPNNDQERAIWDQFIGNKWDTLILSHIPNHDLPNGYFYELIILTPHRPAAEINHIVDWALSHTMAKNSLRIEIIYVQNTLEELSALAIAESSFNLNYKQYRMNE